MKQLKYVWCAVIVMGCSILLSSCKKNITVAPTAFSTPLQALIDSDTSLSVFYAAVLKAKDTALYGGTDSVTVLIPSNAAFASAGITIATVHSMLPGAADSMLRYHFIARPDSLTAGSYVAYKTKLGLPVYGYGNADSTGNYFNGSLATLQTLRGSNAAVYELSAPLQIPTASIIQLVTSDTSLAYFAEAIKRTNLNLSPSAGWNTILAPDNAAFIAAGYPTLASIDNTDATALTHLLQYHILPAQYFTNSFAGLKAVATLQGSNISLTLSNGSVQFMGAGNTTAAGIVTANRLAGSNIIVHVISGVLMP